jgi:2-deoxy-D-gluconate 3-dehydrogenase
VTVTLDLFRLDGRAALVTGGDKGLGQAIAIGLAQAGADVAIVSRSGENAATLAQIEAAGRRGLGLTFDLARPESAAQIVAQTTEQLGRLDVLVNNAGTIRRAPAAETTLEDFSAVLDVNLTGLWALAQAAGRVMLAQGGGKIINIASVLTFQGGVRVPAYTASKHAVAGLTKALANEWAARGINVNAIAPGNMITDNTQALRDDPQRSRQILERIPAERWGTPDDLIGAAVFLASRASDYIHGHVLVVDGGWLANIARRQSHLTRRTPGCRSRSGC